MSTYAEERAAKAAEHARRSTKFEYHPVGMDAWEKPHGLAAGTRVVKVQPHGTPRNGTMGHTFIGDAETGQFIGLVLTASLRRVKV